MDLIFLAQGVGVSAIILFYFLQYYRVYQVSDPVGLSFLGFCFLAISSLGYITLGLRMGLWALLISNFVNLLFVGKILEETWRHSPTLPFWEKILGMVLFTASLAVIVGVNASLPERGANLFSGGLGLLGIIAYSPIQIWEIYRKKSSRGLSLPAFLILEVGLAAYILLGFLVGDFSIFAGNTIDFLATFAVIIMILKYQRRNL